MNRRHFSISVFLVLVAAAITVGFFVARPAESPNASLPLDHALVSPNGSAIKIRMADTVPEQELGLSYARSLAADQGMLFVFKTSAPHPFWMKDMRFPLDIIWLKSEGGRYRVVTVDENLSPDSYPQAFSGTEPADAVLEINAFKSKAFDIVPGSYLSLTSNI